MMESPKYLVIVTLIEGQNFSMPDGTSDKIEASVFAEAKFCNESILKSDPVKLTSSNPEFVTELAWQLDKKSLHQLRIERRAIKLQVFLQTRERKVTNRNNRDPSEANDFPSDSFDSSHKVELIGYTIIDIRSAQEVDEPKFQWLPLLNPKFRKSSYNRPEIQLALSLSRVDDNDTSGDSEKLLPSVSKVNISNYKKKVADCVDLDQSTDADEHDNSSLYRTCLDVTTKPDRLECDEFMANDIQIQSIDGVIYIYDTRDPHKNKIEDCDEHYRITVAIPFNSDLDSLIRRQDDSYYFSVTLFGTTLRTTMFERLANVQTKEVEFNLCATNSNALLNYFELNTNLVIKLHQSSGESLGICHVQLDHLCGLDAKCRSIEGIFALEPITDAELISSVNPSIGVSIVLERTDDNQNGHTKSQSPNEMRALDYNVDSLTDAEDPNTSHQVTLDTSNLEYEVHEFKHNDNEQVEETLDNHHFSFEVDLKNFSYTRAQKILPAMRELVVRYAYPFLGYKDTITTDASLPITETKSIIVSGLCEFNFATNRESLLAAFREIPLTLEILARDKARRINNHPDENYKLIATANLNLAEALSLDEFTISTLKETPISSTITAPILSLDGQDIGGLVLSLSLKDLGFISLDIKASNENLDNLESRKSKSPVPKGVPTSPDREKLNVFLVEAKNSLETWKEDYADKLSEEVRKRETERFKRLCQRLEARDASREHEFRKKMDELESLEKRYKKTLTAVEALEKKLSSTYEHLKAKDALFETRLDTVDLKISKAINDIKIECEQRYESLPATINRNSDAFSSEAVNPKISTMKQMTDSSSTRRSSLKSTSTTPGIPLPLRSSSLVRAPNDSSGVRFFKRPTNVVTTVVNGINGKSRLTSTRLNLSKENQEKLASLRREKAELLKRGCKPNDELILEINSMIEKLAC